MFLSPNPNSSQVLSPNSEPTKLRFDPLLSPKSEPAKPWFGPVASPVSEPKLQNRVQPCFFSKLLTCLTRVWTVPFSELKTQTPNQGSALYFLQTPKLPNQCSARSFLRTLNLRNQSSACLFSGFGRSFLQTPNQGSALSSLRTCQTRVRPVSFFKLRTC